MATSEAGLRETKKRETREHIARTGVELFLERGFEAVSVADIAEKARVSKVTVFNYFPAKEDIFLVSAADGAPDFVAAIEGARSESELVRAVWDYARQAFADRAQWSGLHPDTEVFARVIDESPTLTRAMYESWARLKSAFLSTVTQQLAKEQPEADDAMLHVLVAQIIATLDELTLLNRKLAQTTDPQRALRESLRLIDRVFNRIIGSLTPKDDTGTT